ncbi:MAG TPA: hypothetical protein ENN49_10525 [Bacteroidales bacterium]|nr:hypothetical protein [Bacteroidales bacterium]
MQEKNFTIERQKGSSLVTLSGDLSLNNISDIKSELVKLFSEAKPTDLLIKNAEVVDLGFIQLVRSFNFSMNERGLESTVKFELTADQRTILERSGIKSEY